MTTTGKNRIMIYGPKNDGTYIVEFRTAAGEALAISIPSTEASVVRYFQERDALWTVRGGRFVRNLWRVPCVCFAEPSLNPPLTRSMGFPRPALGASHIARSGGFLVLASDIGFAS
jgi:hypothetical protein